MVTGMGCCVVLLHLVGRGVSCRDVLRIYLIGFPKLILTKININISMNNAKQLSCQSSLNLVCYSCRASIYGSNKYF